MYVFVPPKAMIHRKNNIKSAISANVGLEANAASTSNNSFTSNVYVQTPYPTNTVKPSTFIDSGADSNFVRERDIELPDIPETKQDVRTLILETYANILLNQDVALIANLVSKHTIIIPLDELRAIIQCITDNHKQSLGQQSCQVDIIVSEDTSCCAKKVSPIVKVDFIKVVTDDGQVITDFKQQYNKEYNELTGRYHLNLRYVVV